MRDLEASRSAGEQEKALASDQSARLTRMEREWEEFRERSQGTVAELKIENAVRGKARRVGSGRQTSARSGCSSCAVRSQRRTPPWSLRLSPSLSPPPAILDSKPSHPSQKLSAEVRAQREDFERALVSKEEAMGAAYRELQDEAALLREEREELLQRLAMTERQLNRARQPAVRLTLLATHAAPAASQRRPSSCPPQPAHPPPLFLRPLTLNP